MRFGPAVTVLMLAALPPLAAAPAAEELVFLVQYIGSDYGAAVRDGNVIDEFEYRELLAFSGSVAEGYEALRPKGALGAEIDRLSELIRRRAPEGAVRSLAQELVPRVAEELGVATHPEQVPDLLRGARLYASDCAACHGIAGAGDGFAAPNMSPAPTSFRASRMNLISPHQVFGAAAHGVAQTAMPSYGAARSPQDLWDIAFFVMTQREGFEPQPPAEPRPPSVAALAERSNEQVLAELRSTRPDASLGEVDAYRALSTAGGVAKPAAAEPGTGLDAAEQLEHAFSRAAERAFPGVVGVTLYEKSDGPKPSAGWTVAGADDQIYPGFRRVRSRSGFVVTDDGYVLTCFDLVAGRSGDAKSEVVDVELPGNVHCRARVIGLEPTIDLAVLKIDAPVPLQPVPLRRGDGVRVGQWAIAVGDPPGAQKTFAPGTVAARPERDCYQENRTATLLQTSAAIDPGGLGGPLVNIRGEAIGMTIPASRTPAAVEGGPLGAVNALPIDLVMTVYQALREKESGLSPWLGFSVLELSARVRRTMKSSPLTGIYIDDVFAPSPASRTDIRVGDVLTAMEGNRMLGVSDFQHWLYLYGIDTTVTLEIYRDGRTLPKQVRIEQRPPSASMR